MQAKNELLQSDLEFDTIALMETKPTRGDTGQALIEQPLHVLVERIESLERENATLRAFVAAYDADQAVNVVNRERILASTFETRNAVREARGKIK